MNSSRKNEPKVAESWYFWSPRLADRSNKDHSNPDMIDCPNFVQDLKGKIRLLCDSL